jgi:hypothetical protein
MRAAMARSGAPRRLQSIHAWWSECFAWTHRLCYAEVGSVSRHVIARCSDKCGTIFRRGTCLELQPLCASLFDQHPHPSARNCAT